VVLLQSSPHEAVDHDPQFGHNSVLHRFLSNGLSNPQPGLSEFTLPSLLKTHHFSK